MKVPRSQITPALAKMTLNPAVNAAKLGSAIASYLLSEKRTGELESFMRDLISYRADHGIIELTAVSAHKIDDEVRAEIERRVRQLYPQVRHIIINERIDPELIGGVRLELVNQQLDLTVRGKLNQFKKLTVIER